MDLNTAINMMMSCDLFEDLSECELGGLLMRATTKSHAAGEMVYSKDQESGSSFALLADGSVNIIGHDNAVLETVAAPTIIGEIGPISPQKKRTFTVEACGDVELLVWYLSDIEKTYPELLKKLQNLAWERITQWPE